MGRHLGRYTCVSGAGSDVRAVAHADKEDERHMKVMKTAHIEAHDEVREIGRRCDFPGCEKETQPRGMYEVDECDVRVYVKHKDGESYPEGGSGTEVDIDVCPECFKTKLIPWLESQGVVIERKDLDW